MSRAMVYTQEICLILLLISVALADDRLTFAITSFNSSMVDINCGYRGDEAVLYNVYRDGHACIYYESGCNYYDNNCKFQCKESNNSKALSFMVNLSGNCQERATLKCSVRSSEPTGDIFLDSYLSLTAQSEPPKISINDDQLVLATTEPVPIACEIANKCDLSELEIMGKYVASTASSHTKQGNRYTTAANTTATFYEPGNYTITCKEKGKEDMFGTNWTLRVHENIYENPQQTGNYWIAGLMSASIIGIACVILMTLYQRLRKRNSHTERRKGLHEEEPLMDTRNHPKRKGLHEEEPLMDTGNHPKRLLPEMLKQEGVCGIWINEDDDSGITISYFIDEKNKEYQQTNKVNRAKFDEKWMIQEGPSYKGYFALISRDSLENDNFMVYLTSVLCCSYLDRKFPVVLVLLDKGVLNNQNEEQDKNLMADLKALPQVDATLQLDKDCLADIDAKLQGIPMDTGIGNVGIGLAWSYFYEYLVVILQGIQNMIEVSQYHEKHGAKMSKHFIVILPESGGTSDISEVDSRFSTIEKPLVAARTYHKAWHPHRSYKTYVHQIKMSQDIRYYFCGEYGTPMSSMLRMLKSKKLTQVEMGKQLDQFTYTLRSILQNEPYRDKALVHRVRDVTKLADELCELITNPEGQKPDIYPLKQVSRVAQGLVWSYFHHYLAAVGKGMQKRIEASEHYHKRKMPSKVFILLPYSCDSKVLSTKEGNLKAVGTLKRLEDDDLDYEERYRTTIYEISADKQISQSYFACVEYCTRVQVLHEMAHQEPFVLSSMQKAAELRVFYEILYDMLYGRNAPDFSSNFELVYYNDEKETGKKLSEILVDKIKESLQEEDTIHSTCSNNNTSV